MSKSRSKTSVIPLTKGAATVLAEPIDPKEDKFFVGKSLKDNISLDGMKIPAELANMSVTEVLIFSTIDPQAGGRGELTLSGEMTYSKEYFSLIRKGIVSLTLPNMNMRSAFIQFQVSDGDVHSNTIDSDYYISMNDYTQPVSKPRMRFPSLKPHSSRKHSLSFFLNAEFDANATWRHFVLTRKGGGWHFYKAKVFMLSAM